nr:leucine-rich repeat-containing protein 15-like [Leptinotarsa decemlineata]
MFRVLVFLFTVLVKYVYTGCVTANFNAECKSVTQLSERYINESLENFQNIKELHIRNEDSELIVFEFAFAHTKQLQTIMIRNSRIQRIYENTFKDLPLKFLYINYDGIEQIKAGAFQNLPSLQKVVASHNKLKTVPRGVFKNLPALTTLTLSQNDISSVDESALENLPRLSKLHLDNNKIASISMHRMLSNPEQLEILWLHNNSLTLLTNFMLQKLTKLKLLNLGFNDITAIETSAFEQTPQLETLVLINNKLKEVDGNIFPRSGMGQLDKLYLDNNELMFLPSSFFFRLNVLKWVTLVGNPWECACLDNIYRILLENEITEKCQYTFVAGRRPICVSRDATKRVCSYKYDSELSTMYINHKRKYPINVRPLTCIL